MFKNNAPIFAGLHKQLIRPVLGAALLGIAVMGGCVSDSGPHPTEVRHEMTEAERATIQLREELSKKDANHVDRIIARGANVNSVDADGVTPLHLAAMHGHKEAISLLAAHGARVNVLAGTGRTPLMEAVLNGHEKAVRALLDAGADPNLAPRGQPGPLAVALSRGHNHIAAMLKDHGAR